MEKHMEYWLLSLIWLFNLINTGCLTSESTNCRSQQYCSMECKPPDCRCPSFEIPGEHEPEAIPQMVLFTFDDAINKQVYDPVKRLFPNSKKNPNGAPISVTLFVSDQYTDYCRVRRLWEDGHEVASHSITHRTPYTWWAKATPSEWKDEMVGMKDQLKSKASIPDHEIRGVRAPFLQGGGDNMFKMMSHGLFQYDSTLVVSYVNKKNGRYWPYTLDYELSDVMCAIDPCPEQCYPGVWEIPLHRMLDNLTGECLFLDKCQNQPNSEEEAYYLFKNNFEKYYISNRAPVVFNIHAIWFDENPHIEDALTRFIDELVAKDDVYIVSVWDAIEWIKNPVTLDNIQSFKPWQEKKRKKAICTMKSDRGFVDFILSGNFMVAAEILILSVLAFVLISRDNDENGS